MRLLVGLINGIYPEALIRGTPWEAEWERVEREQFGKIVSFFFPIAALVYVAHFLLYDIPVGLTPIENWLAFRVCAAASCLTVFFVHRMKLIGRLYKLPAFVVCALLCYSQVRVSYYHADASHLFALIFVFLAVFVVRVNAFFSFGYSVFLLLIQLPTLLVLDISEHVVLSSCIVTILACTLTRTAYASDVKNFLLSRERDESQKAMIALSQDFSNRLRSFIPRVIANRLQEAVSSKGMTVLEAAVEVLRPKTMDVVCLFSDIRGFTQGSKNLDTFLRQSALPEIKACSESIESYEGIPRKIGDLVFAYFDDESMERNIVRSVLAGLEISRQNKDLNDTSSMEEVSRYILIASGEAVVGNVGGVDSSVEITALGTSVNYLSRLDEATKHPNLKRVFAPGDLILSFEAGNLLQSAISGLSLESVSLKELGVAVRDFPEADVIYLLKPQSELHELIEQHYGEHSSPEQQVAFAFAS